MLLQEKNIIRRTATGTVLAALVTVIALAPFAVHAQASNPPGSDDPFWRLLAMVPDDEVGHGEFTEITYTNYQALAKAWGVGSVTYEDIQNGTDKSALWLTLTVAPGNLNVEPTPAFTSGMRDRMGFSMLDVHQSLHYGWPPIDGFVVTGNFDLDAIRTALSQRHFSIDKLAGLEIWCGKNGCDSGKAQDVQLVDSTNIFGGILGRSEPVVLLPDLLLDSPSLTTLLGMAAVQLHVSSSLLSVASDRAFAEVITAQGTVLEAFTVNPNLIYSWEGFALPLDRRERVIASVKAFGVLPVYDFVGFAHIWNNGAFYTQIILLYNDAKIAEFAGQEVYTRLANAAPMGTGKYLTYQDQYAETANGELLQPTIVEGQGYAAAIISWRWKLPEGEAPTDVQSPYRLLRTSVMRRDLYYLGTNFVLPD